MSEEFIYKNFEYYDDYCLNYLDSDQAEMFFEDIFNFIEADKTKINYHYLM